jgi:DNA-binding CsgD family transcriptional regulator
MPLDDTSPDLGAGLPHVQNPETRRKVEAMAMRLMTRESIAVIIGISEGALRDLYSRELELGEAKAELKIREEMHRLVLQGNIPVLIFLAKTKLGMSEKAQVEITGKDGALLGVYPAMTKEELRKRMAELDEVLSET